MLTDCKRSLALWLCALAPTAYAQSSPTIELEDCRLESTTGIGAVNGRCGWLTVPENRADPKSRRIQLHVAVVPALNLNAAPDPFVFIPGGPGQAASEEYPAIAPMFERIRRDRHIVLIDQRGTGRSNRLHCEYSEETQVASADASRWRAETKDCLRSLDADPRFYTTSVAVRDLDEARKALGYATWNLWGGSYGTRVAQHYIRRYPGRVRTVVLDGVVPPELILGPGIPLDAQRALENILARCHTQPQCREAFPNVQERFQALRTWLRETQTVDYRDPLTGESKRMSFGLPQLAGVVRLLSYSDDTAALLPYLIHMSSTTRDLHSLAAQFSLVVRPLGDRLANGMHNSIVCTEDVPYLGTQDESLDGTYLGREFVDALRDICSIWPRGVMDKDLHAPLSTDVPALLISGENDPVTPPAYGEQALQGFKTAIHLTVNGQGHINSATGCIPRLIDEFVRGRAPRQLQTECVGQIAAAPFLLNSVASAP